MAPTKEKTSKSAPRKTTVEEPATKATTSSSQSKETASAKSDRQATPVSFSQIAERAYQLWQHRGGEHGADQSDWFKAERELQTAGAKA